METFFERNLLLLTVANCLMFLINALTVVVAGLNFGALLSTAVVHRNLKFILLTQSSAIAGYALCQIGAIFAKFFAQNFALVLPLWHSFLVTLFLTFGILVGSVLLVERILATVFASRYENYRKPHFSIAWFTLLVILSVVISASIVYSASCGTFKSSMIGNLILNGCSMIGSFIEIILMFKLGLHNASKYAQTKFYAGTKRSLSERYQLSENVRTIHQLGPVFVMHFLQALDMFTVLIVQYFWADNYDTLYVAKSVTFQFILSATNLVTVISVMKFHRVLWNRAMSVIGRRRIMLTMICTAVFRIVTKQRNNKGTAAVVPDTGTKVATTESTKKLPPIDIVSFQKLKNRFLTGNGLPMVPINAHQEREIHFRMLQEQWTV